LIVTLLLFVLGKMQISEQTKRKNSYVHGSVVFFVCNAFTFLGEKQISVQTKRKNSYVRDSYVVCVLFCFRMVWLSLLLNLWLKD